MEQFNSELKTMFTADEVAEIEKRATDVVASENPVRDARIERRAVQITSRFEPLVCHLTSVAPGEVAAFEALSPLAQFDELLAPVTPVEIPRIASDPHARRPRYVAGLASRTAADLAYLAAFVRIDESVNAMMSDEITLEDHVENYA
ncbi:hypothetical protein [Arthrobacter sp. UYCo732]|uniref:hypothetical protein n=1 Tax=Arthrobacter sp. UYCo732 TaxID=3156336 RepID=UPI0033953ABF